jgi:hypothetical protein
LSLYNQDFVFVRDKTTGVVFQYQADPGLDPSRYERVEDPTKRFREILDMNDDLSDGVDNAENRTGAIG